MSKQNKSTRILLITTVIFALIALGAGLDTFRVFANGQETCPDGGDWVKVDGLSGKSYTYNAPSGKLIAETCYKAGNEVVSNAVSPPKASVTVTSAFQFDLSHASFRLVDEPKEEPTPTPVTPTPTNTPVTPTPTNTPVTPTPTFTPTPTEEPKEGSLTIVGVCQETFISWTITNGNDVEIPFTWKANNGQSGNGSVPAGGSIKLNTNLDGINITIEYTLNDTPTETQGSVDSCQEEPTPTPTESPKQDPTPTPDPTDPKPQVDPKPDVAAGGSGPSIGSLVTLLGISGASVSLVSYVALKIKNGQKLIN